MSRSRRAMFTAIAVLGAACAAQRRPAPAPSSPGPSLPASIDAAPPPATYPADAIGEAHARRLIGERMRATGLRIVQDVPLSLAGITATIDGLDPDAGVGFEYVAAGERGLDLRGEEIEQLRALTTPRILVIEGGTPDTIEAATDAFLASLE